MKRILGAIVVLAVLAATAWAFVRNGATASDDLVASGTIEVTETRLGPELAGRVADVLVAEGDEVLAGDALLRLDPALLDAQRRQAEAGLETAQRARDAAQAAYEAARAELAAGDPLAAAQLGVADARAERDALQRALDELAPELRDGEEGDRLRADLDAAETAYGQALGDFQTVARTADASAARTAGPAVAGAAASVAARVSAARAQAIAAEGQVGAARAALEVLDVQREKLTLRAPVDGTILTRAVEPGEVVGPAATLFVLGDLAAPRITVYVPEDRVGDIDLGERADVDVDTFPDDRFRATVAHIDSQAQFTPRNVQTGKGRRSTVFAVRLDVVDGLDRLRPGMPADVTFRE